MHAYDGSSSPKEFVRQFKIQAFMLGWGDNAQAQVIPFYLVGKARQVYETLNEDERTQIDTILNRLETSCAPSKSAMLRDFNARSPHAGETYVQYGAALQELLVKAVPTMAPDERLILLRNQLCLQLSDSMQQLVQFNVRLSWEELLP